MLRQSVVRRVNPAGPGVVSKTKRRATYGVRFVSLPHNALHGRRSTGALWRQERRGAAHSCQVGRVVAQLVERLVEAQRIAVVQIHPTRPFQHSTEAQPLFWSGAGTLGRPGVS